MNTSAYGVAAADFTLADEVNQGDYRIRRCWATRPPKRSWACALCAAEVQERHLPG